MKVTIIGAGSASPQLDKNPSACLVAVENEYILIDCGEGTQYRLLERHVKLNRLKTICISHLHGDHYFGLIGLLSSMNLRNRVEPLTLIGPNGLLQIIELQFKAANTTLRYNLEFIETNYAGENLVIDKKLFSIKSFPLIHRVACNGFKVEKKESLRHLLAEKLPKSFPIPFLRALKEGRDVKEPTSGKVYKYEDYTRPGEPKQVFAYCSDTAYNPDLIPILKNADLVYHEATFTKDLADRALETQHSTAEQAALIGKDANVKRLLLGHLSSRYKTPEKHLEEASVVYKNVEMAIEGVLYEIN